MKIIAVFIAMSSFAMADDGKYAIKVSDIKPPKEVAEAIRAVLDPALTVSHGDTVLAEIWWRSELPSSADADQIKNGLTYREIPETTVLGVVRFPKAFVDFRKQEIPAGTYTLRLAVQPETGDHKDTAPHTEFALLSPAAKDATLDTMDAKDLIKLSRATLGGDHPAVMLLYPAKKAKKEAVITDRGDGVMTLDILRNVNANGAATSMGLGITVAGVSKSR